MRAVAAGHCPTTPAHLRVQGKAAVGAGLLLLLVLLVPPVAVSATTTPAISDHWAFRPPETVLPPKVERQGWVQSPIDAFILTRLEPARLTPAPPAERAALLRRVTFDLIGLPPSPDELDAFLTDNSPEAFARVVDRLLASPHYGERWGRHWLDVARYADSNGQDENKAMANAWRYRDYVVAAFNRDKPFDQFIGEQLAGDLLPASTNEVENFERWTATGFLVLGPKMLAEQDKPKLVMDIVDEQIDVVSRAFLGLTVSCSRCHDHKFDPISAHDYYALAGIFKSTKTMGDLAFVSKWNERQVATRRELEEFQKYRDRTNQIARSLSDAIRGANEAVQRRWQAKATEYFTAARELMDTGARAVRSNDLHAVAVKRELHRPTLERWVEQTSRARTNSDSALRPYLTAHEGPRTLGEAIRRIAGRGTNLPATAVRLGPGRLGAGLRCEGANYIEVPHASELEPELMTLEAWVRLDELPKDGETRRWVVNKNANEWVEGHYALMVDGRRAGAYLNIGGGRDNVFAVWSDGAVMAPGQWRHVAWTYDGSDLRLYVDGQPAGTTHIGRRRSAGTGALQLGRRQDGYNYFKGAVDEVRLYRRALGADELQRRIVDPANAGVEGLVRHWAFEPSTDDERARWADAGLADLLFGEGGLLEPPKNPREFYPASQAERIAQLEGERAALATNAPPVPAMALAVEDSTVVDVPVHVRGSHLNLARDPVPRGFIPVLNRGKVPSPALPPDQSGRRELAEWLVRPEHPLTARVTVNRIWQAHFGEGLVRTPDNFGLRGERPTHPELLDWLALDFIRHGWSVKQLHRRILLSSAYQMSTRFNQKAARLDPDNRLLWRMNRRRLEAEPLRDALLAVSGNLDRTMGGSLVSWANAEYTPADTVSPTSRRRALYLPVVRDRVYDVFSIFDFANPSVGVSQRASTVVSHQALFFLNSPFVKEQARAVAVSLQAVNPGGDANKVQAVYRKTLGRSARPEEVSRALEYLAKARPTLPDGQERVIDSWASLCQALFASNEFLYLD